MVISHAALEHIDDLEGTYRAACGWLRPGGMMSHQIDYRCHNAASRWNAHWSCSGLARQPSAIRRTELAGQFKTLSEDDLATSGAHIVAMIE